MTKRFNMLLATVIVASSVAVAWTAVAATDTGAESDVTKGDRLETIAIAESPVVVETPSADLTVITRVAR